MLSFLLGASIYLASTRQCFAIENVADVDIYLAVPFVARLRKRTTKFEADSAFHQILL